MSCPVFVSRATRAAKGALEWCGFTWTTLIIGVFVCRFLRHRYDEDKESILAWHVVCVAVGLSPTSFSSTVSLTCCSDDASLVTLAF